MKKHITFILLGLLILISCNKTVEEYNPNFIGKWYSEATIDPVFSIYVANSLTFTGDQAVYSRDCRDTCATELCTCLNEVEGKAVVNRNKSLMRIEAQTPVTLAINEEPYQENGTWKMKIDGKVYIKQ